jgi:uncharacterized protein YndB with AHSA1/START domain
MDASYESIDGRPVLRFQRRLEHPIAAVWGALTEPGDLSQWFPSTIAGELRPGAQLIFSFPEHPSIGDIEGRVTDFDPPRELGFEWGEDHLRFELAPAEGGGTDLSFIVLLGTAEKAARDGAGWTVCLARLEAWLGGADAPQLQEISDGWPRHYEEYADRGFPATAPMPGS